MADTDEDDFGGFEAAEPVAPDNANNGQAEAGASPWAMFPMGVSPGRPDLLCAQNAFPRYLDPSGISGGAANAGNGADNLPNGNAEAPPLFDAPFDNGAGQPNDLVAGSRNALHQARIAENVLDGTLNNTAAAPAVAAEAQPPPFLPDLGIGPGNGAIARDNQPPAEFPQDVPQPAVAPSVEPQAEAGIPQGACALPDVDAAAVAPPGPASPREAGGGQGSKEPPVEHPQPAPAAARAASRLRQELEAAESRVQQLQEELSQTAQELEVHKSRRAEMQAQHARELEDMQRSSQSCLALVVEEYKEQSKAVALEQREAARQFLKEELQEQAGVFHQLQQRLGEELEERQAESQRRFESQLEQALAESSARQQEEFQKYLEEERQRHQETLQRAVEEEREASRQRFLEAVKEEQEQSAEKLRQEQEKLRASFEAMKEDLRKEIQTAVEEERKRLQEQLQLSVLEERERGQENSRQILQRARAETREYLDERRQADSLVRQRHLASLSLFLETSQQQIRLLTEAETDREPQRAAQNPKENGEEDGAKGDHS